ncbi:orotidine 5'-phosphate decarboxylase / HUMPS family protein [Clostridium tertium]|jgi:3-hexulose-6-phosphate synthase|uniref:orotidine 5'-phosphate decarboxylase / HUMPS family protein n=1 Tax=Clostridium tertium TaxID=1559 RepID=UPI000BE32104|nr:orotidine 5'-phosphate decarboxylase / HUMPS family protein [Clostridium tertium]MBU6136593.1 orotidine 5'-phosphate decarboxylase [Clostridium tertium]MDB1942050.1 orotidine 5'-phosphate decarboxylase [Clostridium tertium]
MKVQVAIDRVELDKAIALVEKFNGVADIIEIGTSLIKDYGLLNLKKLHLKATNSLILGDIKTNDEGTYEFTMGYNQGFDILTVMGSSSLETLQKCYDVSKEYNKKMMIDLLECSYEKIKEISRFDEAIYCLHTSVDKSNSNNIIYELREFKLKFPLIKNIAIAGGINLEVIKKLKNEDINIVVIGSSITAAKDPMKVLNEIKEELL